MSISNTEKLRAENVSFLARQLLLLSNSAREGDMAIAKELGVSIEAIKHLEKMPACELEAVAAHYIKLESNKTLNTSSLLLALKKPMDSELIDEYIIHGANNEVLIKFFGLGNTQIANRREILGVPGKKGRTFLPKKEKLDQISDLWFELKLDNRLSYIEKILYVAKTLKETVCNVYNHVDQVERIIKFETSSMTTARELLKTYN